MLSQFLGSDFLHTCKGAMATPDIMFQGTKKKECLFHNTPKIPTKSHWFFLCHMPIQELSTVAKQNGIFMLGYVILRVKGMIVFELHGLRTQEA